MYILEISQELIDACGDPGLASILRIVQKVMGMIQIIVPIILIVAATFSLIKMMMNPEEKKLMKAFRNCIFAAVIVFFIPLVVNSVMSWLDDSFNSTACWNAAAQSESTTDWEQKTPTTDNEGNKKLPSDDANDYDYGD